MPEDNGRGLRRWLAGTLLVTVVGGTVDLWPDASGDWRSGRVPFELAMGRHPVAFDA